MAGKDDDTFDIRAGTLIRLGLFVVVGIYSLVFVLKNDDRVHIDFVFFNVDSSLWLGFVASLALGAVLGFIATKLAGRGRRHD